MKLKDLLAQINAGIAQLEARRSAGEDVSALLTQLQAAKSNTEAQIAAKGEDAPADAPADAPTQPLTPEQELVQLRARETERQERETAQRAAELVVRQIAQEEASREERLRKYAAEAAIQALGGQASSAVVEQLMKNARGGSRFAGTGASPEVMATLAGGGAIPQGGSVGVADPTQLGVGENLAVKQIREGKNLAHFMGMIARYKQGGEMMLKTEERLFLAESQQKAMAEGTDSAGGYLVHPEWMPDILSLLRAQAVVRGSGPRIVPFGKEMNQTSIGSGATAYYTAENAAISPSEPSLAEAPLLTPKNLTGLVPVSNYLLSDAPQADELVRSDLVEVMALREDLAFLAGTGSGGEPTGLKNMTGKTLNVLSLGTDGGYLSQPQTRAIRNVTRTFNSQNPRWVWFWPPQFLNHLEGLTDADGRYLADSAILRINDDGRSGVYDGVPFYTTTQIPVNITTGGSTNTTYLIMVDVNNLVIGENAQLALAVSTEASYTPDGGTTWVSAFQNTQTLFRATLRHDIAHRRPNHVIVQTGVRVG
jgi:HK97 family phage major capsid protein